MYPQVVSGALGSSQNEKEGNCRRDKGIEQKNTEVAEEVGMQEQEQAC